MSRFDSSVCRDLELAGRREWLETNGIGGFASSTITGMNTRRYHGLLMAAMKPPVGRMVLLSKLEETLIVEGRRIDLSCNRYPGVVHPQGHLCLKEFRQQPFPVFVYEAGGIELEKSVYMVHGENTTVVEYSASAPCTLELRPLIAFREDHATTHENSALNPEVAIEPGLVVCQPYSGLPKLYLAHGAAEACPTGNWYRNFEYEAEQRRGLDYREDLFNPLMLSFELEPSRPAIVIASTGVRTAKESAELRKAEIARRSAIADAAPVDNPTVRILVEAADQFLVRGGNRTTVIAGYHWFSDWGRDTMIALPGLTLATHRYEEARDILLAFAASADGGMLPNRFPDAGQDPEYNTVDATLWFFEAIRAFAGYTGDYEFIRAHLYGVLRDMIAWHERGTRFGIRVDDDGLLMAGEPGVQLTWMDARIGNWVVTPRYGKPVEIQALWYNALHIMAGFALQFGEDAGRVHYEEMAARASASFNATFWNEAAGCLFDVVNGKERDASIRPNQIFAVSLHHGMLPADRAVQVVSTVERHLLTPYGLRTLAPSDPRYCGRFGGDPASRDSAYHQGSVWPWLMGPFVSAFLKVAGRPPEARDRANEWLREFRRYLADEGLGQLPEVFGGDQPQRPGGCIAQAWSVAEVLRVLVEEIFEIRPDQNVDAEATHISSQAPLPVSERVRELRHRHPSGAST